MLSNVSLNVVDRPIMCRNDRMKPLPWKNSPKILNPLIADYLKGLSIRSLAKKYDKPRSTVSRWLKDLQIAEVFGCETFHSIEKKRLAWKKSNIPCLLVEVDTGTKVGLFRQRSSYASYGPIGRSQDDIKNSKHSLIRWPQIELESIVFALCWSTHPLVSNLSLWYFISGYVDKIEIKFARRGASTQDIERLLSFAKSLSLKHRNSSLRKDLLPLTKAIERAHACDPRSPQAIQVAQALYNFFNKKNEPPLPWMTNLLNIYTDSGTGITRVTFRQESNERYLKVFWREYDVTKPWHIFHAEISPNGKIEAVTRSTASGYTIADCDFSIATEVIRRRHQLLMKKTSALNYSHIDSKNIDPSVSPMVILPPSS